MINGLRSEYSKNIITLVTGTTIAQAIPIAISPILTRLYTPEDFGIFALYFSMTMVLSVFATAKYEIAITLPDNEEESTHLVQLSILIASIISLCLLIIVLLFRTVISDWIGLHQSGILLFLPFSVFLIGINQALYYYLNRKKKYREMATGRIARSASYSAVAITSGAIKGGGPGLILSDILSQFFSAITMYWPERRSLKFFSASKRSLSRVARQHSNFPKYSIASGLVEKLAGQAPVFLLTKFFAASQAVGFFSLAQRTIIAPSDLITRAIADVFRQQASEAYALHGECRKIFLSTFKRLLLISILPFGLSFFIMEDAFAWVFGESWRVAGVYARIMLPMFFLQFVVSPLSILFFITQNQKYDMMLQMLLLVGVCIAMYVGYKSNQLEKSLLYCTLVYSVKYVIEFILSYKFSLGHHEN